LLPKKDERAHIEDVSEPEVLVLPGSRTSEVAKLLPLFKETLLHTKKLGLSFKVTIPAVEHLAERIEAETRTWPFKVDVVTNEQEKHAAFRKAHAALAASGTVSLELALSKIPMVIAYKLDFLANKLRFLVKVWTVILPNLILGRPAVREYIDEFARADSLAYALGALLRNTPERRSQIESFDELIDVMQPQSDNPAKLASEIILKQIEQR
jgi:lipid-A-disaccharide synthase